MNLYEYSQQNNQEMGILITKNDDLKLYDDIYTEAIKILRMSEEIKIIVEKIPPKIK